MKTTSIARLKAILAVALVVMTGSALLLGAGITAFILAPDAAGTPIAEVDGTDGHAQTPAAMEAATDGDALPATASIAPGGVAAKSGDAGMVAVALPATATARATDPPAAPPPAASPTAASPTAAPPAAPPPAATQAAGPRAADMAAPPRASPIPPRAEFTVQVASFRDPENAAALVNRLMALEYEPQVVSRQIGQRTWSVVLLGPFATGTQAARAQAALRDALGIEPIVRSVTRAAS